MPDILHRVGIKSSPEKIYAALATREGLAGWWTGDTQGDCSAGGVIHFRFGTEGGVHMKVLELEPSKRVLWQVVDGPADWMGTKVSFELKQEAGFTALLFEHQGWKQPNELMHHCSTKWALFMMSIKSLIETGAGAPYPKDIQISVKGG
jgi:uncharacterized protein YndB with AHSA1/START domain